MSGDTRATGATVRTLVVARALVVVLVVLVALLTGPALAAALDPAITLRTSEASVYPGDSIVIEIEAVGLDEAIDLAGLMQGAELLRETGGTRIGVVDGRVVEIVSRRLEFIAPATGPVVFGPLRGEVAGVPIRSNAVTVTVLPPSDDVWSPDADDLGATFTLSRDDPVIGERIVADLVLRYRDGHAITNERITLPTFDGFDVLPVHASRRVTTDTADGPMKEISWRWLIFATRSGDVTIAGPQWHGEIIRSRTRRANFERVIESIAVDIAPASGDGDWWLPSTGVTLEDAWSRDPRELTAGDELVRTLTLTARDVLAGQLPQVQPLESRSITSTAIGERREQSLIGDHVVSTATFEFRLRATSPVPVFLDTVRVRWWDTGTREADEAIVPARRINIGLPERADLLAELALDRRTLRERIDLYLSSLGVRQGPWWIALAVLSLALIVLLLHDWRRRRRLAGIDPLPPL